MGALVIVGLLVLTVQVIQCASARPPMPGNAIWVTQHLSVPRVVADACLWLSDWAPASLNVVAAGVLLLLFFSLTNSVRIAAGINLTVAMMLGLTNWAKIAILGVPFYPWDIMLISETASVFDIGCYGGYGWNLLVLLVPGGLIALIWRKLPRFKLALPVRLGILIVCVGIIGSLVSPRYSAVRYARDRCLVHSWSPIDSYTRTGSLLAFAFHARNYTVQQPDGYDHETIVALLEPFDDESTSRPQAEPAPDAPQKINLILVLGEAVWDPTDLPSITFNSDPLATLHEMAEQFGKIDVVMPVYGGGTCDTEFEVLTGCNMMFIPTGTSPYKVFIRQAIPSIASMLADDGYHTIALHAVEESYFNDVQVQPRLGFKQFHPATEWDYVDHRGWRITDDATIAETIRIADQQGDTPFFISVNTMGTHWPYTESLYQDRTLLADIRTPEMDEDSQVTLEAYVCGLRYADAAMKRLIDHFADDPRPTLIVHYGDHLPSLGEDYRVYRKCGFLGDDEIANEFRVRTTRATFWANFPMEKIPTQTLSACYMPVVMMEKLNGPMPPFLQFLQQARQQYPVMSISGCIDADQQYLPYGDVAKTEIAEQYRLLQYDRVFGKQYFLDVNTHGAVNSPPAAAAADPPAPPDSPTEG